MAKVRCEACGHTDCKGWQEGQPVHEYRGKGNWHFGCHCDGCTKARNESGGFMGALADHLAGSSQVAVEPKKIQALWQPIETAPRDGTFVLTRAGPWQPCITHFATYDGKTRWGSNPEGFMEEDHFLQYWHEVTYEPTHWMPLPDLDLEGAIETAYRNGLADGEQARQHDQIATLQTERNLFKGKYRALLKLISRTRNKLVHVTDHIQDEGDRRYFGSSNDADELLDLFHTMDAWVWDAVDKTNRMKSDPYADIREQRARAEKAEAEIKQLRKIISDSAVALGNGAFIAPQASVEFMEGLPKEISSVVADLRASSVEPQTGDVAHG